MEDRFTDALERDQPESEEGESFDETLSKAGEELGVGNKPDGGATNREFSPYKNCSELLQELSGDDWANTATSSLGSPRKNLELPLTSEPSNMGMVLLTDKAREENTFEGNKDMFLSTLDEEAWQSFLASSTRGWKTKLKLEWSGREGSKGLLEKMTGLWQDTGANSCKDSSILNKKLTVKE